MKEFVDFILQKVYLSKPIPEQIIINAFAKSVLDVNYHLPELSQAEIRERIETNSNELAIFLFRVGSELHQKSLEDLKPQIHWLLKELCGCELYFNNDIGEGFYVIHGEGTVIGSRNKIGKGFKIHQGCTIGHKKNGDGNGNTIGDNVTMYANASIIGQCIIGDNVVVGGHVMVHRNIEANKIITLRSESAIRNL